RDRSDPWTQSAVLSAASPSAHALLRELAGDESFSGQPSATHLHCFTRLAALIGARGKDSELAAVFSLLAPEDQKAQAWKIAILHGLGQGLQNSRPLSRLWEQPPPDLQPAFRQAEPLLKRAVQLATEEGAALHDRLAAVQLLGYGPFTIVAAALQNLLDPRN